ncbi:hypothetical protein SPI_05489 [Niveomyces insectorum RCEF 264]|uniref:Protein kinase-like domain protein n=1 Tax=Niveomyces insectorum RCEF 264 TaxID=1081102 RepID=A0A167T9R6_9HYPO|nr:hypothetical protein SPI_05489 [Niveomyces insectorum RCEF 264]
MTTPTPIPYVEGQSMELTITRTFSDEIPVGKLAVAVGKVYKITQSPVMVIAFDTKSGPMEAVLKLYDRRFGPDFRTVEGKYSVHTSHNETAWQEYVDRGLAGPFFQKMAADQAESMLFLFPDDYYDDSWEGLAQYEGGLQRQVLQYFDTETKTYDRLRDLQGTAIPVMLAHVCVSRLQQIPDSKDVYFRIPGIVIQHIKGSSLSRLVDIGHQCIYLEQAATLEDIVQSAVDVAHAINKHGVILRDCRPENVIVEQATRQPFFYDFAQCGFEEECAYKPDDPDDQGFRDAVRQHGNPRAIGMVMAKRAERELGFQLQIRYPELGADTKATNG